MIPLFIIIPLACAFLIPVAGAKFKILAPVIAAAGAFALLLLSLLSVSWIAGGDVITYEAGGWPAPFGILMVLDGLSVLMLIVVNIIGFLSLLYSVEYMKKYTSPVYYYTLFSLLLAGLNGTVISGDLFNLFVFVEISAVSSYALVAFGTEKQELEAAFRYAVLGTLAFVSILLGIGMVYSYASTLNMADLSAVLAAGQPGAVIPFVAVLFIAGFGLKAALVPFHSWLPDAHPAAPAPISAMLSGVVIKTIGIYALVRILFNVIGMTPDVSAVLAWLGIISMLAGVLLAIGQWDFKRLLAYHSISQIGYVVFGIALGTPVGIIGGLFHLLNHSLFKSLLFLNAGSVEQASGTRKLDELGGLSDSMPVTGGTSLIASLSIAGIPPFCGFWSKLIIIIAAFQAGHTAGAVVCIFTGIVTLASFLKVQQYVFLRKKEQAKDFLKEAPLLMKFSMVFLAVLCVLAGVLFMPLINAVIRPAADVLLQGTDYAFRILGV